jgi:hypothetical protein
MEEFALFVAALTVVICAKLCFGTVPMLFIHGSTCHQLLEQSFIRLRLSMLALRWHGPSMIYVQTGP